MSAAAVVTEAPEPEGAKVIPWPDAIELGPVSSAVSVLGRRLETLTYLIDKELDDLNKAVQAEQEAVMVAARRQRRAQDQLAVLQAEKSAILRAQSALEGIARAEEEEIA